MGKNDGSIEADDIKKKMVNDVARQLSLSVVSTIENITANIRLVSKSVSPVFSVIALEMLLRVKRCLLNILRVLFFMHNDKNSSFF